MARVPHLVVGFQKGVYEITDKQVNKTNVIFICRCVTCGDTRTIWSSSHKDTWLTCRVCASKDDGIPRLPPKLIFAVTEGTNLSVHKTFAEAPENARLYEVGPAGLLRECNYVKQGAPIPPPNPGYSAHLAIPAKWVQFALSLEDLPEGEAAQAMATISTLGPDYPTTDPVLGDSARWLQDGELYQYIYWR